jgi:hypothetical protein
MKTTIIVALQAHATVKKRAKMPQNGSRALFAHRQIETRIQAV